MSENNNKKGGERPGDPCTIVIFGASGDLTKRKLLPALYNLAKEPAAHETCGHRRRPPRGQREDDVREEAPTSARGRPHPVDDPDLEVAGEPDLLPARRPATRPRTTAG